MILCEFKCWVSRHNPTKLPCEMPLSVQTQPQLRFYLHRWELEAISLSFSKMLQNPNKNTTGRKTSSSGFRSFSKTSQGPTTHTNIMCVDCDTVLWKLSPFSENTQGIHLSAKYSCRTRYFVQLTAFNSELLAYFFPPFKIIPFLRNFSD